VLGRQGAVARGKQRYGVTNAIKHCLAGSEVHAHTYIWAAGLAELRVGLFPRPRILTSNSHRYCCCLTH
jgi:hypothetical protein